MYRVLIVEDDRGIAESVRDAAATWGFDARCAENFRDVAGEFAAFAPHLALMDIGTAVFRRLLLVPRDCASKRPACRSSVHFLGERRT